MSYAKPENRVREKLENLEIFRILPKPSPPLLRRHSFLAQMDQKSQLDHLKKTCSTPFPLSLKIYLFPVVFSRQKF